MNWRTKLSAWADLLFRRIPPPASQSDTTAHPHPVFGEVYHPLTVSEAGRLGAAAAHSSYRARVAAKADQLRAELQQKGVS